jgi:hypothetical protein
VGYDFPSFKKEIHMNKLSKVLAGIILECALITCAHASEGVYNTAKHEPAVASPRYTIATLTNYTSSSYMSYSSFLPSHLSADMQLGYSGSGIDSIRYTITYPDNIICLDVVRADGYVVWFGCLTGGNYGIYPGAGLHANDKLVVKLIK